MSSLEFKPSGGLKGSYVAPADKSLSHRAAIIAALSEGSSQISNYLLAEDTQSTLNAVAQIGATVQHTADGRIQITGVGLNADSPSGGPRQPAATIDVGNAGTLMRLLPGWLAGQPGLSFRFDGDHSIRKRPIDRVAEPLKRMGATFQATDGRLPPFTVEGAQLKAISYRMPVASAQVKSAVLLAALLADGRTELFQEQASRDHTERMLAAAGVQIDIDKNGTVALNGPVAGISLGDFTVPADLSSAAFLIAGAVIVPGSDITVKQVGVNWTRTGFLTVLERMGVDFQSEFERPSEQIPTTEPLADLRVKTTELVGTTVRPDEIPLAIDELPLIALLGCFAEGQTVVTGAAELRVKESDRISGVVNKLRGLGADIEELPDGFVVTGTGGLAGGVVNSDGDHRIAMLGAVAGLASSGGVMVENFAAAAVSYPGFIDDLKALL